MRAREKDSGHAKAGKQSFVVDSPLINRGGIACRIIRMARGSGPDGDMRCARG